jgi:hypothetical protein
MYRKIPFENDVVYDFALINLKISLQSTVSFSFLLRWLSSFLPSRYHALQFVTLPPTPSLAAPATVAAATHEPIITRAGDRVARVNRTGNFYVPILI